MNPLAVISAFFLFASSLCLRAQESYEYGVIAYTNGKSYGTYQIIITLNDVLKKIEGKLSENDVMSNFSPLNSALSDLTKEGWEIYNSSVAAGTAYYCHYFYVKRKKP